MELDGAQQCPASTPTSAGGNRPGREPVPPRRKHAHHAGGWALRKNVRCGLPHHVGGTHLTLRATQEAGLATAGAQRGPPHHAGSTNQHRAGGGLPPQAAGLGSLPHGGAGRHTCDAGEQGRAHHQAQAVAHNERAVGRVVGSPAARQDCSQQLRGELRAPFEGEGDDMGDDARTTRAQGVCLVCSVCAACAC